MKSILQMERQFALGFVLGVLRHQIDVIGPSDDLDVGFTIGECLARSGVKLVTVYELAVAEVKDHPDTL